MLENMLWLTCCVVLRGLGAIPIVFAIALYINPFDARVHRVGHVLLEAPYRDHVLSLSKLEISLNIAFSGQKLRSRLNRQGGTGKIIIFQNSKSGTHETGFMSS